MPATAADVLSVSEIKDELRIPQTVTELDSMLSREVESAISHIERETGLVLIERTNTIYLNPPAEPDSPLVIDYRDVSSVESIKYWTPSSEGQRVVADGTVGSLGNLDLLMSKRQAFQFPPSSGWPEVLSGTPFAVEFKQDLNPLPKAIKQAVIVVVREYFDGHRYIKGNSALYALLRPWRRLT